MSKTTFRFEGKDDTSAALKSINDSLENLTSTTKKAAASINTVNVAIHAIGVVVKGIAKVVSLTIRTIINVVKAALKTIRNILSTAFKWIKTAITTLLSWITKALGKIFDGVKNILKGIFNFAKSIVRETINVVKKGIDTIIDSVQKYANKQYNEIQLKVSLGDSYDAVMSSYKELLKYTTADKNELLSVYATFAEVGKSPEEILKYAKATVYVSQATGKSLDNIARIFLRQEAAGSDLEKTLKRIGINITDQEASLTDIEKIISVLDKEVKELSSDSLAQSFANIKNNVIAFKENLGQAFAGPVKKIADKIAEITEALSSKDLTKFADYINSVFETIWDKVEGFFDFIRLAIKYPEMLREIKEVLVKNWENLVDAAKVYVRHAIIWAGAFTFDVLGQAISLAINKLKDPNFWGDVSTSINNALNNLVVVLGWVDKDNVVEGNFRATFIKAWNAAHPEFTLSETDTWFENLKDVATKGFSAALGAVSTWLNIPGFELYNKKYTFGADNTVTLPVTFTSDAEVTFYAEKNADGTYSIYDSRTNTLVAQLETDGKVKFTTYDGEVFETGVEADGTLTIRSVDTPSDIWSAFKDGFMEMWNQDIFPALIDGFEYLGTVLATAIGNIFATNSDLTRWIDSLPFIEIGTTEDIPEYQQIIYDALKKTGLDTLFGIKSADQLTKSFLHSEYKNGETYYDKLMAGLVVKDSLFTNTDPARDALKKLDSTFEEKLIPTFEEWKKMKEPTEEIAESLQTITNGGISFTVSSHSGAGIGGGGGIVDYFATSGEFKIKPYAKGGLVNKPTIALIGEAGPELIIPAKNIPKLGPGFDPSAGIPEIELGYTTGGKSLQTTTAETPTTIFGIDIDSASANATEIADALAPLEEATENLNEAAKSVEDIVDYYRQKEIDDANGKTTTPVSAEEQRTWWDDMIDIFNAIKKGWNYFWDGEWVDDAKTAMLAGAEKLGSFLDGIEEKIESIKWADIKKGIIKLGEGFQRSIKEVMQTSFKATKVLMDNGAFGQHLGNIYKKAFDDDGSFSIMKAFAALIEELLPYLQEGLKIVGDLFDKAFAILGNVVQEIGARLGEQLMPILEAFVPLMKIIGDILISLCPVLQSVLQPAITIIAAILRILVPILDALMPVFAGIGAVIQLVCDSISWAISSFLNWIAGLNIFGWTPLAALGGNEVKAPKSLKQYYNEIMDPYHEARSQEIPSSVYDTSSTSTAAQTVSYSGSNHIYITNDFSGAYVVGSNGFRELALIIKNTMLDLDYTGQTY